MTSFRSAHDIERRTLQLTVILTGLVPVSAGVIGGLFGAEGLGLSTGCDAGCDSHFRYLSGLLAGIGLTFWSLVPRIETRSGPFAMLTVIVVIGGLARLFGTFEGGLPPVAMSAALAIELGLTPALCAWQRRIARLLAPFRIHTS